MANLIACFNPYSAEKVKYAVDVLVSWNRFILIPILWIYNYYEFEPLSRGWFMTADSEVKGQFPHWKY